jgi:hypothetical protein
MPDVLPPKRHDAPDPTLMMMALALASSAPQQPDTFAV